jgi:PAS domain S-box-containing protein
MNIEFETMIESNKTTDKYPIKILIVEDERIVALDLRESLRSLGYVVIGMAASGDKAIELVKDNKPDLILMDIMLKGEIDGITTTQKILSEFNIPVIYLTAYADENTVARAKVTEPYGYLLKPFEVRELHTTIEMALYNHRIETAIKESERWLFTTLRSVGDGMIATESDGKIKFMNPVAESLTGWKQEESVTCYPSDIVIIVDEFTGERIEDPIKRVLQERIIVEINDKVCLKHKDGRLRAITVSASPIIDKNERVLGGVLVLKDISAQRKSEREREDLLEEVINARERLKLLSRRLIEMQESDRRSFAYELHEEIGQTLTTAKINLQALNTVIDQEDKKVYVVESVNLIEDAIKKVRSLSLDMRPSMLDDLGLIPAIRWYVTTQTKNNNLESEIDAEEIRKRIPTEIQSIVFRIVQEAVKNVITHSEATTLKVSVTLKENILNIGIEDNGRGFNVDEVLLKNLSDGGMGIVGIRERVLLMGGEFNLKSETGKGTRMFLCFPI